MVGSNTLATSRAAETAREMGYIPYVLTTSLTDEALLVGEQLATLARFMCRCILIKTDIDNRNLMRDEISIVQSGVRKQVINQLIHIAGKANNTGMPICIIAGGESVVRVKGRGQGGRSQEMTLVCAMHMDRNDEKNQEIKNDFVMQLFSAGTDGIDGPTPAAGAFVTPKTMEEAQAQDIDVQSFLSNNDSFHFFQKLNNGANHVITGQTGTNVMDMQLLFIHRLTELICTARPVSSMQFHKS